jgi:hypothetical protein
LYSHNFTKNGQLTPIFGSNFRQGYGQRGRQQRRRGRQRGIILIHILSKFFENLHFSKIKKWVRIHQEQQKEQQSGYNIPAALALRARGWKISNWYSTLKNQNMEILILINILFYTRTRITKFARTKSQILPEVWVAKISLEVLHTNIVGISTLRKIAVPRIKFTVFEVAEVDVQGNWGYCNKLLRLLWRPKDVDTDRNLSSNVSTLVVRDTFSSTEPQCKPHKCYTTI